MHRPLKSARSLRFALPARLHALPDRFDAGHGDGIPRCQRTHGIVEQFSLGVRVYDGGLFVGRLVWNFLNLFRRDGSRRVGLFFLFRPFGLVCLLRPGVRLAWNFLSRSRHDGRRRVGLSFFFLPFGPVCLLRPGVRLVLNFLRRFHHAGSRRAGLFFLFLLFGLVCLLRPGVRDRQAACEEQDYGNVEKLFMDFRCECHICVFLTLIGFPADTGELPKCGEKLHALGRWISWITSGPDVSPRQGCWAGSGISGTR